MTDTVHQEARKSVERLQTFDVEALPRRDELGSALAFDEAKKPAERLLELFRQVPMDNIDELSTNFATVLRDNSNAVFSILDSIQKFNPNNDAASSTRNQIIRQLVDIYDHTFSAIHPVISYLASRQRDFGALERQARAAMQAASDRAEETQKKMTEMRDDGARILEELRKVSAERGVSQQAEYFKSEADMHDKNADKWKSYTIKTSIGLGIFAAFSIFIHKIPFLSPSSTYDAIQLSISKGFVFATIAFMLALSARNFMSHKHNAIVNRHRQNALLTFKALCDAAGGEDKRDIVLTHAASCIFHPQETGYARTSGGDGGQVKLIEIAPKLGSGTSSGG